MATAYILYTWTRYDNYSLI